MKIFKEMKSHLTDLFEKYYNAGDFPSSGGASVQPWEIYEDYLTLMF